MEDEDSRKKNFWRRSLGSWNPKPRPSPPPLNRANPFVRTLDGLENTILHTNTKDVLQIHYLAAEVYRHHTPDFLDARNAQWDTPLMAATMRDDLPTISGLQTTGAFF